MEKENLNTIHEKTPTLKPGAQLAQVRENKGISREVVAAKLHFTEQTIELLEADAYDILPEAVFIKGYIRAYAKFLSIDSEPLIEAFNQVYVVTKPVERTLWQPRKASRSHEKMMRAFSGLVAISVVAVLVSWWYQHNQLVQQVGQKFKSVVLQEQSQPETIELESSQVSKIQSLFEPAPAEHNGSIGAKMSKELPMKNPSSVSRLGSVDKLTQLPSPRSPGDRKMNEAVSGVAAEAQSG